MHPITDLDLIQMRNEPVILIFEHQQAKLKEGKKFVDSLSSEKELHHAGIKKFCFSGLNRQKARNPRANHPAC